MREAEEKVLELSSNPVENEASQQDVAVHLLLRFLLTETGLCTCGNHFPSVANKQEIH